jgi:hypothetical protein
VCLSDASGVWPCGRETPHLKLVVLRCLHRLDELVPRRLLQQRAHERRAPVELAVEHTQLQLVVALRVCARDLLEICRFFQIVMHAGGVATCASTAGGLLTTALAPRTCSTPASCCHTRCSYRTPPCTSIRDLRPHWSNLGQSLVKPRLNPPAAPLPPVAAPAAPAAPAAARPTAATPHPRGAQSPRPGQPPGMVHTSVRVCMRTLVFRCVLVGTRVCACGHVCAFEVRGPDERSISSARAAS